MAPQFNQISKRPLYREEIRDTIYAAIKSGELGPGDRLVETKWAKMLGVSQSPVREAIRELESMGLIENIPYKGAIVRKITKQDVKESYLVRIQLDQLGASDAVAGVTPDRLEEIQGAMLAMEQAAGVGDMDAYVREDVRFHELIMTISTNKLLIRLWQQCNIQVWTHIGTAFSDKTLVMLAARHRAIYEALRDRDQERLLRETRQHIEELMEDLDNQAGD